MALLKIHIDKIVENISKIDGFMREHNKEWSLVVKVLGNHRGALEAILEHSSVLNTHSIAVSQWKNLKLIKDINPELTTLYIKPPVIKNAENIVRYADISFNSSFMTISALNAAAKKLGLIHRVIIMIEMGELREGIKREGLIDFYQKVFKMSNLDVIGIGANLGCMIGVQPSYDKLLQLVLYEQLIEAIFDRKLELISGASSIALPLLAKDKIPAGVNHFRIGEAAFLGTSPLNNKQFLGLNTDTFTFEANIVELYRKSNVPDGIVGDAAVGHSVIQSDVVQSGSSYHAVADFGVLDADADTLIPQDPSVKFFGNSSDMTVYNLGENTGKYETGKILKFKLKYMAAARLMAARYIDKMVLKQ